MYYTSGTSSTKFNYLVSVRTENGKMYENNYLSVPYLTTSFQHIPPSLPPLSLSLSLSRLFIFVSLEQVVYR